MGQLVRDNGHLNWLGGFGRTISTTHTTQLVPGDIIGIGLGDLVPADAKILGDREVTVDQSALTGESLPVTALQSGIVYSSSVVRRGEARCIVVNTGANTYFGTTAQLVRIAKPVSHQEQVMMAVVKYMMYVSLACGSHGARRRILSPLTASSIVLRVFQGVLPC